MMKKRTKRLIKKLIKYSFFGALILATIGATYLGGSILWRKIKHANAIELAIARGENFPVTPFQSAYSTTSISYQSYEGMDLFEAIKEGEADAVTLILSTSKDKNLANTKYRSNGCFHNVEEFALHSAINSSRSNGEGLSIIKALLNSGADIEAKDRSGYTPLMYAAKQLNSDAVKLLIENGANPNTIKIREAHIYNKRADGVSIKTHVPESRYTALDLAKQNANATANSQGTPEARLKEIIAILEPITTVETNALEVNQ